MDKPFQKYEQPQTAISPAMLPLAGLLLGMLTWIIDAAVDVYLLHDQKSLAQNLIAPDSVSEFWMRLLILIVFVLMGYFSRRVLLKHITLNKLFLEYHDNLEKLVEERTEQLEKLANRDPLTNLYNRRKFSFLLSQELQRFNRYQQPFSLINIDIDHFKKINDSFGHDTGDKVIKHVSNTLRSSIRQIDHAVRWGGEEFILLIIHADYKKAVAISEKLKTTFNQLDFPPVGKITVSMGITEVQTGDTEESIINRSDRALYRAKENGRNRIETA